MIERDTPSQRLYVHHDANCNVTAILDTLGNVVERYTYDPFGQFTVLAPNWTTRSVSSFAWIYLHQSGRYDSNSGLFDFRSRAYSSSLGRWIEQDPIGFRAGDTNLYRYLRNDPSNGRDPYGLAGWVKRGRKPVR